MASELFLSAAAVGPARSRPVPDWALVALATLAVLGVRAAGGFPTLLSVEGDNDSLMRLAEVRDLLNGQGWFDLHQHRMGPEGGFVMHWSRLIDAPVALLTVLGAALTGSTGMGETAAQFAWPSLLFAGSLLLIMRVARRIGGAGAAIPALVIGAAALHFISLFAPGMLDHHNAQLFLTLAMVAALMESEGTPPLAGLAGVCAALMLGIGMETAPYLAAAGLFVALRFLLEGRQAAAAACWFGLALALASAAVFAGTVAPGAWSAASCDAFSLPQFALAALGGLGLAAAARFVPPGTGRIGRLGALAALAGACAAAVLRFFPQCLANPYGGLDPELFAFWLSGIAEAQSFARTLVHTPVIAAGYYGTVALAALLLAGRILRHRAADRDEALLGLILGAALLTALWQVRGSFLAIPLAVPVLAAWVAARRAQAERLKTAGATAAALLSWLLSVNLVWGAVAALAVPLPEGSEAEDTGATCARADAYAAMAALAPARVLAFANIGSQIMAFTAHHPLAGLYHRNGAASLQALRIWSAPPDAAEALVRDARIGLVAFCPGNAEAGALAANSPRGLAAAMAGGAVPSWLEPVAGSETAPLRLFTVSPR